MKNKAIVIHYKLCPLKILALNWQYQGRKIFYVIKIFGRYLLAMPIQHSKPIFFLRIFHGLGLFNFGLKYSKNGSLTLFWGVLLPYWLINVEKLKEKAVINFLASWKFSGNTLTKYGYYTESYVEEAEYTKLDICIYLCSIHNFKDNCTQISQVTNIFVKISIAVKSVSPSEFEDSPLKTYCYLFNVPNCMKINGPQEIFTSVWNNL